MSKNRQNQSASARRKATASQKPGLNPKQFPVLFLIALVVVVSWWWFRPAPPAQSTKPSANPSVPATATPAATAAAEPSAPVAPPPKPAPATTPTSSTDPLADLQTAVPYTLQQLQAGNYIALLPPDQVAQMSDDQKAGMVAMFNNPQAMQRINALAAALQSVQGTPPTLDSTGNTATYTLPPGSPSPTVVFHKINGQWYGSDPGGQ